VIDMASVTPTVEDVSNLERTRTLAAGGQEVEAFGEDTRPSYNDVEELIQIALPLVLGELDQRVAAHHYDSIKHAVTLYTAMLIEGSFFREAEDGGNAALWRTLYNTAALNLKSSITNDKLRARTTGLESWRPPGAMVLR
jgi:hypothetical protein